LKLIIIYWSGTGNTEKMAELIKTGAKQSGLDVTLKNVASTNSFEIDDYDILALGCPSMGCEEIEESEMQPFVDEITPKMNSKKLVLFGSYGWRNGEWLEKWKDDMIAAGAVINIEPLAINETHEGEDELKCIDFGKKIISSYN